MKIDFHSHILPGIDDGSRDIEESVELLDYMADDHVDIVAATPHYYCGECSVDHFIERRNDAYERLKPHLKPHHPKIILGAEVLYNHVLVGNEQLSKLCLQGTDFVMLEMPYRQLTEDIIDDVEKIYTRLDVKLLIAHIERYLHFTSYKELAQLMGLNVLGQINAKSLMKFSTRRNCLKLIKDGYVHVMGTDYHRRDSGHALIGEGYEILAGKCGKDLIRYIEENGRDILENRDVEDIG